ncbi:hypothetical protein B0H16DRAFT_1711386 [Mycena metata]|uniref:Uncharacterized protein n=1 Tax=Mycena metata TaxID=1033252 RepID=A0AAD7NXJ1_9AGAR|nr:hypothetical protein B0H16DRAFT_1711386 [Mycena metata]
MVRFYFHERIRADIFRSTSHFLANAAHGQSFAATRDRGADGVSFWSFKVCEDFDVNRECPWRYPVRPYAVNIFGNVDFAHHLGQRVIVRLGCPIGASCRVQVLYEKQLAQLKLMVEEDHDGMTVEVRSNWFSPTFEGTSYPASDSCFYVSMSESIWRKSDCQPGESLELEASFRFTQTAEGSRGLKRFVAAVSEAWALSDDDMACKGVNFVCDRNPGFGCAICL